MASKDLLQCCIRPVAGPQGEVYEVYLVNNGEMDINVNLSCHQAEHLLFTREFVFFGHGIEHIVRLPLSGLQQSTVIHLDMALTVQREGLHAATSASVKLRDKVLLKSPVTHHLFADPVYVLPVMSKWPAAKPLEISRLKHKWEEATEEEHHHAVHEKALLGTEIDLHAEALGIDVNKVDKHAILSMQLQAFEDWLDHMIRFGHDVVYAIHGSGKGKLKAEIHHRLRHWPHIRSFNNNYHPKYGYGATEIYID